MDSWNFIQGIMFKADHTGHTINIYVFDDSMTLLEKQFLLYKFKIVFLFGIPTFFWNIKPR